MFSTLEIKIKIHANKFDGGPDVRLKLTGYSIIPLENIATIDLGGGRIILGIGPVLFFYSKKPLHTPDSILDTPNNPSRLHTPDSVQIFFN